MTKIGQALGALTVFCVLGAAIFLTLLFISPPPPVSSDAPAEIFSADRAFRDLEIIAEEPHPMGISPAHAEVRDYLIQEIRKLGLDPEVQKTNGVRVVESGWVIAGAVENILVRVPGTDPDGVILLSSHYDSTPGGPGGSDSGSGVVVILELLRALNAGPAIRHDVIFFFSDGEEPGTIGAHAFVAQHPWFTDVRFAINIDQVIEGPPMLVHSSQATGNLIQALARNSFSNRPAFISFPFDLFPGGDTDLLPFELAGVPGAEIDAGAPIPEKHTILDRPEVVNPSSLQQAGNQLLAVVRYLGDQSTLETSVPEQTFFPMLGRLVHYPSRLALPFTMLAVVVFLGAMLYGIRTKGLSWRGAGWGFLFHLLILLVSVLLVNLIWKSILAVHPEYAYLSFSGYRQKLSDEYLYVIGFFVLVLAVTATILSVARKRISRLDLAAGSLIIWLPLTTGITILFPALSYICTWSLLSASAALGLALAVRTKKAAWELSGLSFLASGILATFLWVPLLYIAVMAGPLSPGGPLLILMIATVVLWLGALLPILDWIITPQRWLLPSAAVLVAFGFLLAGHFLVGKDSPPPLVNPIGYWLNVDEGEAFWVTFSDELDQRQAHLLANPVRHPYRDLFAAAPQFSVLTSLAPVLDQDGPRLEILSDSWVGDKRVVNSLVTTSMHDRVYIIVPKEFPVLAFTLPNNERVEVPRIVSSEWVLRFDGMPAEGVEMTFEFSDSGPIQMLLVEEKTGLPSFPGLSTQPEPGTIKSPGEFYQGIPTDFTAINRNYSLQSVVP